MLTEHVAAFARRLECYLRGKMGPRKAWLIDEDFAPIYREIRGRTLVDRARCYALWQLAHQTMSVAGDAAEIGVYKGGTARLLGRTFGENGKLLHLFDTFAGMPAVDARRDLHRRGDFEDTSLEKVQSFLRDLGNVRFHRGLFPATASAIGPERRFSFVHVDADIYTSVRDSCQFFYPRLSPGSVMVFDDYGFVSCPGAKEAVDEFFATRLERPIYLPTGQCIVIRLSAPS